MGTIPRGIHSYQELRKRWMFSVLVLGSVGASTAYLFTASLFITTVCFLFAQVISFADFLDFGKPLICGLKKCSAICTSISMISVPN